MTYPKQRHPFVRGTTFRLLLAGLLFALTACGSSGGGAGGGGGGGGLGIDLPALLAADSAGGIYLIDPATGSATKLADTGLGPIASMVFDPATTTLFGATANTDEGAQACPEYACVYKVTPTSGSVELFADNYASELGVGDTSSYMQAMAVNGADAKLFGMWQTECPRFFSIDKTTTAGTVLNPGLSCASLAMAFAGDGTLYSTQNAAGGDTVVTIDPSDGTVSAYGAMSYSGFEPDPDYIASLAGNPQTGYLYMLGSDGTFGTVNMCDLTATYIGTPTPSLTALVLVHTDPLPTPSCL